MSDLNWQYSRNQLLHYVDDGERYGDDCFHLFEIRTSRPMYTIRRPSDMYRLIHKGKHVDMHKQVKVLKETARRIIDRERKHPTPVGGEGGDVG